MDPMINADGTAQEATASIHSINDGAAINCEARNGESHTHTKLRNEGAGLSASDIQQVAVAVHRLQKTNKTTPPGPDPHELAAAILKKRSTEHWRFWQGEFYRYTGTHYEPIAPHDFRATVNSDVKNHLQRQGDGSHVTKQRVANVAAALESRCLLPSSVGLDSWLDRPIPTGAAFVSLKNGIVEIPAGADASIQLHRHSPQWFSLTTRTYNYEPEARCPKWYSFLDRVMEGDAERIAIVQEWFGLCLSPHGFRQFFFVAEGEGANGKGTAFSVLKELLGTSNVSALPIDQLNSRFGPAGLLGKSLNISSESERISADAEAQLKAYTGEIQRTK